MQNQSELRICLDIGSVRHYVAIGLSTGERIDGFYLNHTSEDIEQFFEKIEKLRISYNMPVVMAMEGFNGYARPIDRYALDHGYSLYSVNNMKLARFKEVFPGPAKTDPIDAWAIFSLFQVQETLPLAKNILQKVEPPPVCNEQLKHISRRRRELVKEKTRIINRLQGDLQAVCPGLLSITKNPANLWFLRFLASKEDMTMLLRMQKRSLLQIKGVGEVYAEEIQKWQKTAKFSSKVEWIGKLIVRDVRRLLEMLDEIAQLEVLIEGLIPQSKIASRIESIPGYGSICAAELAGEIGSIDRFKSEASLALYLGIGILNKSSGQYEGSRSPRNINWRGKGAMMTGAARHIQLCDEAAQYYKKKRAEGKKHNQAVRAFARHMIRVIWSILIHDRDYRQKED